MSDDDRDTLRRLAGRVRRIADDPVMSEHRRLWIEHNALRERQPLVLCFPEGCWPELVPPSALQCRDPLLRGWELALRQRVFWWEHIHDDAAYEPYFDLGWRVDLGDFGVPIPRVQGDNRGSFTWDPPIKDLEKDIVKLRPRVFSVDRAKTMRQLELANKLFGDILPARIRGGLWWTVGLTQTAAYLVGIEHLMYAMMDQPQAVHRLMAFLRDDMMSLLNWSQEQGLLTPRNEHDYVGSGGLGYSDELPGATGRAARLDEIWGFGESQETVGISPAMFDEFVMPYQRPLLEKFALNCYGCCEGLEHRIDVVMRNVPRLRRISVSPKADQAILADKLAGRYIYSRKADPVPVCVEFSEETIRRDIRRTLELAGGGPLEIILKDTHTVQHDPTRITRWVRIARAEIERRRK